MTAWSVSMLGRMQIALGVLFVLALTPTFPAAQEKGTRGSWPPQSYDVSYGEVAGGGMVGGSSAFRMRVTVAPSYYLPGNGAALIDLKITSEDLIETKMPMTLAQMNWVLARQSAGTVSQVRLIFDRGMVSGPRGTVFKIPSGASRLVGLEIDFKHDRLTPGEASLSFGGDSKAIPLIVAGVILGIGGAHLVRRRLSRRPVEAAKRVATPAAVPIAPRPEFDIEKVKSEFERLQQQLRDAAVQDLTRLREISQKYNALWADTMGHLEDYLNEYPSILPGLEQIWEQFASREDARRIADAIQEAIDLAALGTGAVLSAPAGVARTAARRAARAEGAIARAEIQAARAEAAATRGEVRDVLGAKPKPASKPRPEPWSRPTPVNPIRSAADEALAEAKAKEEVFEVLKGINAVGGDMNCWNCAYQALLRLRGIDPMAVAADVAGMSQKAFRKLIAATFQAPLKPPLDGLRALKGIEARDAIIKKMAEAPDGSVGVVTISGAERIELVDGVQQTVRVGHAFNVVKRNGHVIFADAQTGKEFTGWARAGDVQWTLV